MDQDLIYDLTLGMEPKDGVIWVYGIDDDGVMAFTDDGIEEVRLILEYYRNCEPPKSRQPRGPHRTHTEEARPTPVVTDATT